MRMEIDLMEHRWGTRVLLDVQAMLHTNEGTTLAALVKNASVSGAFVETGASLPLLSRVSLAVPGKAGGRLDACVVRVDAAGMALEWMDPGSRMVPTLLSMRRDSRGNVLQTVPERLLSVPAASRN